MIPALPVVELRRQADVLARQLREVDTLIQRTNWEAELLD
ncbi:DIP1984 family protein [Salinispora fenicalii]